MRGRPKKKPEDRRSEKMEIPLTESEKQQIKDAAESRDEKPVTWARSVLLKAAKRRLK